MTHEPLDGCGQVIELFIDEAAADQLTALRAVNVEHLARAIFGHEAAARAVEIVDVVGIGGIAGEGAGWIVPFAGGADDALDHELLLRVFALKRHPEGAAIPRTAEGDRAALGRGMIELRAAATRLGGTGYQQPLGLREAA